MQKINEIGFVKPIVRGNGMTTLPKYTIFVLLVAILLNCNSAEDKQTQNKLADTITQQLLPDETQALIQTDTKDQKLKFSGKTISFYSSHSQIPQVCKDIYTKKRSISDDKEVLALMDSIFTNNDETRPFYFLTITQTMKKADGAYAEPLGIMGKEFVEKRTKEFLNYFINEPMLINDDFNEWISTVVGEIKISAEGHEKEEASEVIKIMTANCSECNEQQKQKLDTFTHQIRNHCP